MHSHQLHHANLAYADPDHKASAQELKRSTQRHTGPRIVGKGTNALPINCGQAGSQLAKTRWDEKAGWWWLKRMVGEISRYTTPPLSLGLDNPEIVVTYHSMAWAWLSIESLC
jgi:hypothetical protein